MTTDSHRRVRRTAPDPMRTHSKVHHDGPYGNSVWRILEYMQVPLGAQLRVGH